MRFTSLVATAVAALAALVTAQSNPITSPSGGSITAGQSTTITWSPTDQGTITLTLRSGSSGALQAGTVIASNIPNTGTYTWTPDTSVPTASDYTIEIQSSAAGSSPNYSPRFSIGGGSASSSGSSASGSTTSGSSKTSGSSSMSTTGSMTTSGNSTSTTSTTSTTTTSNSTTTSSSSTRSSTSRSTASSTSGGSSAPSNAAVAMKGSDAGIVAAVVGLAGLVAMI